MRSQWVLVTPEKARDWLTRNKNNRVVQPAVVARYVSDIRSGRWQDSPQGAIIAENGDLLDGQHRLLAICAVGSPVKLYVTFDAPAACKSVLDLGRVRNAADILAWQHPSWKYLRCRVAVALQMYIGSIVRMPTSPSTTFRTELVHKYRAPLDYIAVQFPTTIRGITQASVLAAIARASAQKHTDGQRLAEFCEVLRTGMTIENQDSAAVLLRNWLLTGIRVKGKYFSAVVYRKTQRALCAFLNREKIAKLYESEEDLFPIPYCLANNSGN